MKDMTTETGSTATAEAPAATTAKPKVQRKPKAAKQPKAKRPTIGAKVTALLSRETVPADAAIIAEVRENFKGTKFDEKHLAWYKSRFRQGLLTGMKEGTHVINQPAKAKKAKVAKAARKPKLKVAE